MANLSAQDYRNIYERFYCAMRNYLWTYDVLKQLADLEVDIYSAFIDKEKLREDFDKLSKSIKDVCKDDEHLEEVRKELADLVNSEDVTFYSRLGRVQEVDPQKDKRLIVDTERRNDNENNEER